MATDQQEWARHRVKAQHDEHKVDRNNPQVVAQIQKEAKANGATLAHGGRGGLDPKVALAAFRRGKWTCSVPGCKTPKKGVDLDHPSGHKQEIQQDPEARDNKPLKKAAALGHSSTDPKALRVVCVRHHTDFHNRERAIERGQKPNPVPR